jgi:dTDP-4-amino-4,6-dideoxygalactose transaminase
MPDYKRFIPVAKPWLGNDEAEAAQRAILSGWVTQGPEVAAFEREFADYVGAKHACAVSSCTAALHIALKGVGVSPGDEVITVSHSFVATANSIRYCGAIPVFIDIEPTTYNMNPDLIERVITEKTKAILCVHQMGMPCDLRRILDIARRHSLPVIEDAACAIGSEILWQGKWEKVGRPHGDVACFSFHPRKLLTTGDGGMLTTTDNEIDTKFRLWRQHGMSVPDTVRHGSPKVIFEEYVELGFNYRMTDIQAAIGREQLKKIPSMLKGRREYVQCYQGLLGDVPDLRLPVEPSWAHSNWQSFCVGLPVNIDQQIFMQAMLDAGIASRRGVMCAHREPAYDSAIWSCGLTNDQCDCPPRYCQRLQQSEYSQNRGIILPLYHDMTSDEIEYISHTIRKLCV